MKKRSKIGLFVGLGAISLAAGLGSWAVAGVKNAVQNSVLASVSGDSSSSSIASQIQGKYINNTSVLSQWTTMTYSGSSTPIAPSATVGTVSGMSDYYNWLVNEIIGGTNTTGISYQTILSALINDHFLISNSGFNYNNSDDFSGMSFSGASGANPAFNLQVNPYFVNGMYNAAAFSNVFTSIARYIIQQGYPQFGTTNALATATDNTTLIPVDVIYANWVYLALLVYSGAIQTSTQFADLITESGGLVQKDNTDLQTLLGTGNNDSGRIQAEYFAPQSAVASLVALDPWLPNSGTTLGKYLVTLIDNIYPAQQSHTTSQGGTHADHSTPAATVATGSTGGAGDTGSSGSGSNSSAPTLFTGEDFKDKLSQYMNIAVDLTGAVTTFLGLKSTTQNVTGASFRSNLAITPLSSSTYSDYFADYQLKDFNNNNAQYGFTVGYSEQSYSAKTVYTQPFFNNILNYQISPLTIDLLAGQMSNFLATNFLFNFTYIAQGASKYLSDIPQELSDTYSYTLSLNLFNLAVTPNYVRNVLNYTFYYGTSDNEWTDNIDKVATLEATSKATFNNPTSNATMQSLFTGGNNTAYSYRNLIESFSLNYWAITTPKPNVAITGAGDSLNVYNGLITAETPNPNSGPLINYGLANFIFGTRLTNSLSDTQLLQLFPTLATGLSNSFSTNDIAVTLWTNFLNGTATSLINDDGDTLVDISENGFSSDWWTLNNVKTLGFAASSSTGNQTMWQSVDDNLLNTSAVVLNVVYNDFSAFAAEVTENQDTLQTALATELNVNEFTSINSSLINFTNTSSAGANAVLAASGSGSHQSGGSGDDGSSAHDGGTSGHATGSGGSGSHDSGGSGGSGGSGSGSGGSGSHDSGGSGGSGGSGSGSGGSGSGGDTHNDISNPTLDEINSVFITSLVLSKQNLLSEYIQTTSLNYTNILAQTNNLNNSTYNALTAADLTNDAKQWILANNDELFYRLNDEFIYQYDGLGGTQKANNLALLSLTDLVSNVSVQTITNASQLTSQEADTISNFFANQDITQINYTNNANGTYLGLIEFNNLNTFSDGALDVASTPFYLSNLNHTASATASSSTVSANIANIPSLSLYSNASAKILKDYTLNSTQQNAVLNAKTLTYLPEIIQTLASENLITENYGTNLTSLVQNGSIYLSNLTNTDDSISFTINFPDVSYPSGDVLNTVTSVPVTLTGFNQFTGDANIDNTGITNNVNQHNQQLTNLQNSEKRMSLLTKVGVSLVVIVVSVTVIGLLIWKGKKWFKRWNTVKERKIR